MVMRDVGDNTTSASRMRTALVIGADTGLVAKAWRRMSE